MTVTAKVVCDSISREAIRITTVEIKQPRIIHSEFMTHRALSKNASSSRAIPNKRMLQNILDDPARPVRFGANQPGMQDKGAEHTEPVEFYNPYTEEYVVLEARDAWDYGLALMANISAGFAEAGYHKQIANRLVETWSHITLVVTATEWDNFFLLRDHEDADPTIAEVARAVKVAMAESQPKHLKPGQWHLPYADDLDTEQVANLAVRDKFYEGDPYVAIDQKELDAELVRISAARCARVSYLNHEGKVPEYHEDNTLFLRLMGSQPFHATPTEHQATPDEYREQFYNGYITKKWTFPEQHGNFYGWRQYRKMIHGENGGTRNARF